MGDSMHFTALSDFNEVVFADINAIIGINSRIYLDFWYKLPIALDAIICQFAVKIINVASLSGLCRIDI